MADDAPVVVAVHRSSSHSFSKSSRGSIVLIDGLGVEGDAHLGTTVQHRSRVRADPTQPNLRQVHLLDQERIDALVAAGFDVAPGAIGENITTRNVDLHALATGTRLRFNDGAAVEITGLRNPCRQLDEFQPGLMSALRGRSTSGALIRKAGVMGVVVASGRVAAGDAIVVSNPAGAPRPLETV